MYVYFDSRGDLKEIINDEPIRQGSSDKKVYFYFEGLNSIDGVWTIVRRPDKTLTTEIDIIGNVVTKEIPYDKKRDMKFFKDFQPYRFFYYDLEQDITSQTGLAYIQVRCTNADNEQIAYGVATFNVVSGVIQSTTVITQSQYDYLLEQVNMRKIWIRYADDENGTNMTETYNLQTYMGVFVGGIASTNPSDYTWLKFSVSVDDDETLSNLNSDSPLDVALNLYQAYLLRKRIDDHLADLENPHQVTKTQVGLGNVRDYGVESTPSITGQEMYITSKGVYDYLNFQYTKTVGGEEVTVNVDYEEQMKRVDMLFNVFADSPENVDNVVNTIMDLINVFANYPESADLVTALSRKADKTTVEGIDERVEALEWDTIDAVAIMDIEHDTDKLTLTPNEFIEQETPEYEEFPFVANIKDDRFKNAVKISIVYDVPNASSDILSSGIKADITNGIVYIYAMEQPSENVIIKEIDIINRLQVYQLYDSNMEQQVTTNKNNIASLRLDVDAINNTKLPQYLKKQETNDPYTSTITHSGDDFSVYINDTDNGLYSSMYMESGEFYVELGDGTNVYQISLTNTGDFTITNFENNVRHLVTFDTNGDLKVDNVKVQSVGNLVTSFQVTPDDTHYPSEKLVKDSLDAKGTKVVAFNSTPSDTSYPSEKLVKDNLDLKQDKSKLVTNFTDADDDHYPSALAVKNALNNVVTIQSRTINVTRNCSPSSGTYDTIMGAVTKNSLKYLGNKEIIFIDIEAETIANNERVNQGQTMDYIIGFDIEFPYDFVIQGNYPVTLQVDEGSITTQVQQVYFTYNSSTHKSTGSVVWRANNIGPMESSTVKIIMKEVLTS